MFDQVFWRATAGQINRWRRNLLHLGGTSLDKMELHKIPFLYNFSPHVVPPPLDWPEWIRVTGKSERIALGSISITLHRLLVLGRRRCQFKEVDPTFRSPSVHRQCAQSWQKGRLHRLWKHCRIRPHYHDAMCYRCCGPEWRACNFVERLVGSLACQYCRCVRS